MNLNELAWRRCQDLLSAAEHWGVAISDDVGARVVDCGVNVPGGIGAGCLLAEICLAGLGKVSMVAGPVEGGLGPWISVTTDNPWRACIGAQYAGWPIEADGYFAMGSGPMRALRGREAVLEELALSERSTQAIGILEAGKLPSLEVCKRIADECHVAVSQLTLLVAPTSSIAGTIQIVARSLETALHKLHTLGFDLKQVESGYGLAPLPPVAADDLQGIGRTNDAILYGGEVTLWLHGSDNDLRQIGPQVPSQSSRDFGRPFAELFAAYGHDFYRIDPQLFSPAVVTLISLESGRSWRFGQVRPDILRESFGCESVS